MAEPVALVILCARMSMLRGKMLSPASRWQWYISSREYSPASMPARQPHTQGQYGKGHTKWRPPRGCALCSREAGCICQVAALDSAHLAWPSPPLRH